MVDVTNGTNVHMGLVTLESSGQSTRSHLVAGEDMVDRVDGARAQQRRPAGTRQEVQRTRDARHLAIANPEMIDKRRSKRESRWERGTTGEELTAKFSGPGLGALSHTTSNQKLQIAEIGLSSNMQ